MHTTLFNNNATDKNTPTDLCKTLYFLHNRSLLSVYLACLAKSDKKYQTDWRWVLKFPESRLTMVYCHFTVKVTMEKNKQQMHHAPF